MAPRTNAPAAGALSPNADGGVVSTKNEDVLLSIVLVPSVARTRQVYGLPASARISPAAIVYEVAVNPVFTSGVPLIGVTVSVYDVAPVDAVHLNVGVALT